MKKLDNKTFNNGTRLKIDKPRGYTLKIIDVSINNYVIPNKRRYIYERNV